MLEGIQVMRSCLYLPVALIFSDCFLPGSKPPHSTQLEPHILLPALYNSFTTITAKPELIEHAVAHLDMFSAAIRLVLL